MDTDDDIVDFEIESSLKRKCNNEKSTAAAKKIRFSGGLVSDEKCAVMNSILPDILPDNYEYKVNSFQMLKESAVAGESQFHLECRINVRNKDEWKDWFDTFCSKSGTSYNKSKADVFGTKKVAFSGQRKCIHNVKEKRKGTVESSDQPTKGPGRKKGQARVPGKQTCCPANLTFQLAGDRLNQSKSAYASKKQDVKMYPMLIKIHYEHNHSINSADALRYRPISDEVKKKLLLLFAEGHSPSSAYQAFKNELAAFHGDKFITTSADRSIMPDYFYVYHFHADYMKKEYGTINGVDSYKRAVEKIESYNAKHNTTLAKIGQTEDGETCVAICDKFNQRCHENLPQAGDLILVDATSNLNRQDTKLFHIMTPSAIGALPLGTVITSREDEETLKFGFDLFKSLLSDKSFYGRGPNVGPKLALTDDSDSERNALKFTWPSLVLLLCLFHVLQAVWGWLWKGCHSITKDHRPILFNTFKKLVYARNEEEYSNALDSFDINSYVAKYPNYSTHVKKSYLNRKADWALSERIARKLETHGTNTTNYVEASFRLTKENQFHRIRAYNLPDLLGIILDDSEYYVQRCIDVGNNRISKLINQKSKYLYSRTNIDVSKIEDLGDGTYRVPSEQEKDLSYFVDMNIGLCECPVGVSKGPCKHKHVLAKHFQVPSLHTIPAHSSEMRAFYHYLGTGNKENATWYRPLNMPDTPLPHVNENHPELELNVATPAAAPEVSAEGDDANVQTIEVSDVINMFEDSVSKFAKHVIDRIENDPVNYSKAISAFSRQCGALVQGKDAMIQKALHTFGKESTFATVKGRKKNSGRIPIQNTSKARRKFLMRGRGSISIKGRPTKDLPKSTLKDNDLVWHTLPKQKKTTKKKRPHSIAAIVKANVPSDKKH